jgi:hypothetical protein
MLVLSFDTIVPLDARLELCAAPGTLRETSERNCRQGAPRTWWEQVSSTGSSHSFNSFLIVCIVSLPVFVFRQSSSVGMILEGLFLVVTCGEGQHAFSYSGLGVESYNESSLPPLYSPSPNSKNLRIKLSPNPINPYSRGCDSSCLDLAALVILSRMHLMQQFTSLTHSQSICTLVL